jgi:hypothetical protein
MGTEFPLPNDIHLGQYDFICGLIIIEGISIHHFFGKTQLIENDDEISQEEKDFREKHAPRL